MPELRQQLTAKEAWTGEGTFATTLLLLYVDAYGDETMELYGVKEPVMAAMSWDPETIRQQIEGDIGAKLPPTTFSRLMTAIRLQTSDEFYHSTPDFDAFCRILTGDSYDPRTVALASVSDMAWGITEALLISPPDEENPFSPEICAYIGKALDREGFVSVPPVLRIATERQPPRDDGITYADDAELYAAIQETATDKTLKVDQLLRTNFRQLLLQLQSIPLTDGKTEDILERLSQALR